MPRDAKPSLLPGGLDVEETLLDAELADEPIGPAVAPGTSTGAAQPVAPAERFTSVDVLRGFALLGILAMNIVAFSWPGAAYGDPLRGGGFQGTDRAIWFFNHLVFEAKMMTIFSMLFGAGLVLMNDRAAARGTSFRRIYVRRVLALLAIGAVHAYLIWAGDVLFLYAECGLLLYFFRNLAPRTLILGGVTFLMLIVPLVLGLGAAIDGMKRISARVDAQVDVPNSGGPGFNGFSDLTDYFAARWTGQIKIETAGEYTFTLGSDDGSRLFIDGKLVINHDGLHGYSDRSGSVTLSAGFHDIRVEMFEGRTADQKAELARALTEAAVKTLGCSPEAVDVMMFEGTI